MESWEPRFWAKVDKAGAGGCWWWMGSRCRTKDGESTYGLLRVGRRVQRAHRLSWELHFGAILKGQCVLHKCDNPACVNPRHLWIGTQKDNARDRSSKGRNNPPIGCHNGAAKLNPAAVRAIRDSDWTGSRLADFYGVSRGTISLVRRKRTWAHV